MSSLLAALQATFADSTAVRADPAPVAPSTNANRTSSTTGEKNAEHEFLDAFDADGLSAASARRLAAVREPNHALRHERATVRALPPPRVRQLELLAAARRDSLDGTLGWLLALGNAHLALEHEDAGGKAKAAKKAAKKDKEKDKAGAPPPLASMEQLLLAKDEQILALNRRVDEAETKYLNAFALLSIDDKRRLAAMTPTPSASSSSKPRDKHSSSSSKPRHKEKRSIADEPAKVDRAVVAAAAAAPVVQQTPIVVQPTTPPAPVPLVQETPIVVQPMTPSTPPAPAPSVDEPPIVVSTVQTQPSPPSAPPAPPTEQPPVESEVERVEEIADDDDDDNNQNDSDREYEYTDDEEQQIADESQPPPPADEVPPESIVNVAAPESAD